MTFFGPYMTFPFCQFAMQAKAALEKLPIVAQFSVPSYSGRKGLDVIKVRVINDLFYFLICCIFPMDQMLHLANLF